MSSTSSAASAVSASGLSEPECEQSRSAKSSRIAAPCSESTGPTSPATTTLEALQPNASKQMALPLTSSAAGSRVRTFPLLVPARASAGQEAVYGQNTRDSFANFDPDTSSWRTSQACLTGGLAEFSETWPRSGLMRNGRCYPRACWVGHTHESGCFYWHTPTSNDKKPAGQREMREVLSWLNGASISNTYIRLRSLLAAREGQRLPMNPAWAEWLMGFPVGWSETLPSATRSSPQSRKSSAVPSSKRKGT